MSSKYMVGTKEYYRAGAWNALKDARALYDVNSSRGVAQAMHIFRVCRQLSKMNPKTKTLLENRAEHEKEFMRRQKTWNPWAQ
ncbi:MAG: hypothetical protein JKY52_08365 [Flavobacteriales bacterium]|nr:hypothetical protein [Flavobacteriales bacterium]